MLDFGDEFTLEICEIPWLLWIQLLVFLLLLALLFCFTIVALDPSREVLPSSPSAYAAATTHPLPSTAVTNRLQNSRGVENLSIKGEIATTESTQIVREEIPEGEASSLNFLHPCYYFRLARVAFLKCLGLDSSPESDGSSSPHIHRKTKES